MFPANGKYPLCDEDMRFSPPSPFLGVSVPPQEGLYAPLSNTL
jgi:hypothetical protein